jgi:hypothetical protein
MHYKVHMVARGDIYDIIHNAHQTGLSMPARPAADACAPFAFVPEQKASNLFALHVYNRQA